MQVVHTAPPAKLGVQAAQLEIAELQVTQEVAVFGKYPAMQDVQFMLYPPDCWQLTQLVTTLEQRTQLEPLAV